MNLSAAKKASMVICSNILSQAAVNASVLPTICAFNGSMEKDVNGSMEKDDIDLDYLHDELMLVDEIAKYISLLSIILSITGNILVIICHTRMQNLNAYKWLIINLAVSDLAYSIMQIFQVHRRFHKQHWHFGQVLCKMMALSPSSLTASMFTMSFMAIERFITIVYPFRARLKKGTAKIIIVLLWAVAISIHIPFSTKRDIVKRNQETFCVYTWKIGENSKTFYHLLSFMITYPIPILIILVSSINIVYAALKGIPKKAGKVHAGGGARVNPFIKYRKLLCTFISIFLVFIVTTTPNQALILWMNFAPKEHLSFRSARFTFFMLYMFAPLVHMHAWMNPLIYSFSDEKFRAVIMQLIRLISRKAWQQRNEEQLLRETPHQKDTTNQRSHRCNSDTKTSAKL